nr:hypothetical protein [Piscirickettsia salmonis]
MRAQWWSVPIQGTQRCVMRKPRVYSRRVLLGDFASLDVQNTYRGSDAYVTMEQSLRVMRPFQRITEADFYFARPYRSCDRGLNEHTNGLIRRFLPKGTDFNEVSDKEIAKIEHTLNTRRRASLNYCSPNHVFLEYLMAA